MEYSETKAQQMLDTLIDMKALTQEQATRVGQTWKRKKASMFDMMEEFGKIADDYITKNKNEN